MGSFKKEETERFKVYEFYSPHATITLITEVCLISLSLFHKRKEEEYLFNIFMYQSKSRSLKVEMLPTRRKTSVFYNS